eukprot:6492672-Amphidinium_carterae.3
MGTGLCTSQLWLLECSCSRPTLAWVASMCCESASHPICPSFKRVTVASGNRDGACCCQCDKLVDIHRAQSLLNLGFSLVLGLVESSAIDRRAMSTWESLETNKDDGAKRARVCELCGALPEAHGTRWAKKNKATGCPVGEKCFECAMIVVTGFPGLSWEQAVIKAGASEDFKLEVKQARANFKKSPNERDLVPEEVTEGESLKITVRKRLQYMTVEDFTQFFEMSPKDAGVKVETLEFKGEALTGVFLQHETHPFQEVFVDRVTDATRNKTLLESSALLRQEQATDHQRCYNDNLLKTLPASVAKHPTHTIDGMKELVAKKKAELEEKKIADRLKALGQAVDERAAVADPGTEQAEERLVHETDDEVSEEDAALTKAATLGGVPKAAAASKGKGKRKSKGAKGAADSDAQPKKRGRGQGASGSSVTASAKASGAPSGTGAGSRDDGTGRSRSRSPAATAVSRAASQTKLEQLQSQCRKYCETLTIERALMNDKGFANDHVQASRVLQALQKQPRLQTEAVTLESHLELIAEAKKVNCQNIAGLAEPALKEVFEKIAVHLPEHPPWQWGFAVVQVHMQQLRAKSIDRSLAENIAATVVPRASPEGEAAKKNK